MFNTVEIKNAWCTLKTELTNAVKGSLLYEGPSFITKSTFTHRMLGFFLFVLHFSMQPLGLLLLVMYFMSIYIIFSISVRERIRPGYHCICFGFKYVQCSQSLFLLILPGVFEPAKEEQMAGVYSFGII